MAVSISPGVSSSRAQGFDAPRAEPARRREPEGARGAPDAAAEAAARQALAPRRVLEVDATQGARPEPIRGAAAEGGAYRPGVSAYLGVQRGTVTDPAGGELVGIDIYV